MIKAQNLAGLADKFNDIKEGKYHSAVKEPLGKSFLRGYQWPEKIVGEDMTTHKFGKATIISDPAKEILYPQGG